MLMGALNHDWTVAGDHTCGGCSPPPPFSLYCHLLPNCCCTHSLSASIIPLPFKSSFSCRTVRRAANKQLERLWGRTSSHTKLAVTKIRGTKYTWSQVLQSLRVRVLLGGCTYTNAMLHTARTQVVTVMYKTLPSPVNTQWNETVEITLKFSLSCSTTKYML